jgi:hypothetical protein
MTDTAKCLCPAENVHVIVCRDGAMLTLSTNLDASPVALAGVHAAAVAGHGGLLWHSLECPECGHVYFRGMAV